MPRLDISPCRAAIFDLDGTLVHSEPAWELAERRVLAAQGRTLPQESSDAFVGRGLRGFLAVEFAPLCRARLADFAAFGRALDLAPR